jgi:hypothetical protein
MTAQWYGSADVLSLRAGLTRLRRGPLKPARGSGLGIGASSPAADAAGGAADDVALPVDHAVASVFAELPVGVVRV